MPTNNHANNKYEVTVYNINTVAGNPGAGVHVAELHITPKNSLDPVFAGDFKINSLSSVYFNGHYPTPYDPRTTSYSHVDPAGINPTTDSYEFYYIGWQSFNALIGFSSTSTAGYIAQAHFVEVYQNDNGDLINNEPVGSAIVSYSSPTDLSLFLDTWTRAETDPADRGTISANVNPVFIRLFIILHNLPDPFTADILQLFDLDLVPHAVTNYGCTDPNAINYSASANIDDGSCTYFGCTNDNAGSWPDINGNNVDGDPCLGGTLFTTQPTGYNITNYPCIDATTGLANGYETVNFNPQATIDDGSCLIPVTGCGDDTYIEYNPNADFVDNTTNCITPIVYGCVDDSYTSSDVNPDINGNCVSGAAAGSNGLCAAGDGYFAYNYNPNANINQVSLTDTSDPCGYCTIYGCTDNTAFNYDASADCDDGSCIATITGCFDPQGNDPVTGSPLSSNYNYLGTTGAINHDPTVNTVNLADCYYFPGCTDSADLTYYTQTYIDANGVTQLMFNACVGGSVVDFDDGSCSGTTNFIAGCTDSTATNYLQSAVVDDCSCVYPNPVGGCMDDTAGDNPDINGDCTSVDINGNIINVGYPNPHGCGSADGYLSANYDPAANTTSITDPGTGITTIYTCHYYGCTDSNGSNYDATATIDDGSCVVDGVYYLNINSANNTIGIPNTNLNNGTTNNPTPNVHIIATAMGAPLTGNGPSNGFITNQGLVDFSLYEGFTFENQSGDVLESAAFLFVLVMGSSSTLAPWENFPLIFSTAPSFKNYEDVDLMVSNQYFVQEAVLVVAGEIDIATLDPGFNSTAWSITPHTGITFSGINSDPTSPYFGTFEFTHGDITETGLEGDSAHDPATDGPGYQFEIVEEYTGTDRADIIALLADQRQQSVWGGVQLDQYLLADQISPGPTNTGQVGYITYLKCKFYTNNVNFDYATGGQYPNLMGGFTMIEPIQFVYKPGCMDQGLGPLSTNDCNYWADATVEDASLCSGTYFGCTDSGATNYDALAGCDDGSCTYANCVGSNGQSNLGPGTFYSGSYGALGYGLVGNVTPFSPGVGGSNPTKTNVQEFDPSMVGFNMACNGINTYNNTTFLPYNNHRVFHADFTNLMVEGQLPSTTPLLSPDTALWTLFTSQTSDDGTNNSSYTGVCNNTTTHNFWSRDHLNVGSMYRRWSSSRTRLYLKGMHDTYIESGLHGGTSGSNADITTKIAATRGLSGGIPYGIHGMYIKLDNLDVNDEYTLDIRYRYIPKWNNNYTATNHVTFNKQSDDLRAHIRLGWGYYGTNGINSADGSNGNLAFIDYNGIVGQGVTQIPPPDIANWGGVTGDGPYHSLIEGRLRQWKAYKTNGQANIDMHREQINFSPTYANNNVLMISIGNGFRMDIEAIQIYCV